MSQHGFIAITRDVLDHPVVGARKPYSEFAAWIWLLCNALWKPQRIRVTCGRAVGYPELKRGQLSYAHSFLAKGWGWSSKRVRTFLHRLEMNGQIDLQTDGLQTVITICNYDHYQNLRTTKRQLAAPQTDPEWTAKRAEEEQRNPVTQASKDYSKGLEKGGKPRHGARTKDGKRVWLDSGTMEHDAYDQEHRKKYGDGLPKQWGGAGSWVDYFSSEVDTANSLKSLKNSIPSIGLEAKPVKPAELSIGERGRCA
jgi:hypothetical protein